MCDAYERVQVKIDNVTLSSGLEISIKTPASINNYTHCKVWVKLFINSQTWTVAPLKFGNG